MFGKFLGFLIGTAYLVFFWVGGPFSLYILFFASAETIRDWFFIMAFGAALVSLLTWFYEQVTRRSNPLSTKKFIMFPLAVTSIVLNLLISSVASFWI
ncbi:MAG: hypothetical protein R3189_01050 [Thiomicrorhabdus chilensis]|uniref:hypothetical protein n=1 Tax=Thiomicrorhabdus chilensis TaxID=63656 RepID=UPI0003F8A633|nr:hypothetical protein [Thiomicrorhabdus chilensis]MDX1346815.1 hypothetical protein [Thiomicrorhabdus chilensis]